MAIPPLFSLSPRVNYYHVFQCEVPAGDEVNHAFSGDDEIDLRGRAEPLNNGLAGHGQALPYLLLSLLKFRRPRGEFEVGNSESLDLVAVQPLLNSHGIFLVN